MFPLIEINDPRLGDPDVVIIDVRAGAEAHRRYLEGHLPRAIFADLDKDLSIKPADPAYGGRHPLPLPVDFAATLTGWGITPATLVIAYDDKNAVMGGARLWWMLRATGHEKVQVVNGGLKAALDAGVPLSTDDYRPRPAAVPYPAEVGFAGTVNIEERRSERPRAARHRRAGRGALFGSNGAFGPCGWPYPGGSQSLAREEYGARWEISLCGLVE